MKLIRCFAGLLALLLLLSVAVFAQTEWSEEKPATKGSYVTSSFGGQAVVYKMENRIPMVIAHKTDWRNFPEVSLLGINSCIQMGVDIAEIDIHLTKDGVPVLLHDTNIRRMTNDDTAIEVNTLTWAQLKKYHLEDGVGHVGSPYTLTAADAKVLNAIPTYVTYVGTAKSGGTMPVSRYDSALELSNKQIMYVLDKVEDSSTFAILYRVTREYDMLDYVIFKNGNTAATMETWYTEAASHWNSKHPSEPITAKEVQQTFTYECTTTNLTTLKGHVSAGTNLKSIACSVTDSNRNTLVNSVIPWCVANGVSVRANSGEGLGTNAKIDSPIGWAELLETGVTAIMTDHPSELVTYLQNVYGIRKASDRIQGEHFTNFDLANFGFDIPLEWNSAMNQFVNGLTSKDTLIYRKISFDGNENMLTIRAKGSSSKVMVYIDGTESEDLLATLSLTDGSNYQSVQSKIKNVTVGEHTVYLKFSGTVALDQFRFARGLYFGFDNLLSSRVRYQDITYGSVNCDTGNWFARTATMGTVSYDNTAGTMSATLTAGGNHYIQTGTGASARPLHYIPQTGDYFQMTLKIDKAVANDSASKMYVGLVFSGSGCGDFDYNQRVVQEVSQSQINSGFFTVTLPMNSSFTGATEITAIRLYFMNFVSASGQTGKITVDHVYIGPKEALPQQDCLYFDFTGSETELHRYLTENYGYTDYTGNNWLARMATMRGTWYDFTEGHLMAAVTTGGNHYIQASAYASGHPLHYKPHSDDHFQLRMKIENCVANSTGTPITVGIVYYDEAQGEYGYDTRIVTEIDPAVIDNGFFTVTLPMNEAFQTSQEILGLRMYFTNLAPKAGKEGLISVDALYIGPKAQLPKAPVKATFRNWDGTVLAEQDLTVGEIPVYVGDPPVKSFDMDKHYVFSGWDKELTALTEDTVFTAQFTGGTHTWDAGSVTKAATCTEAGEKHCSCADCGAEKTEVIPAAGHDSVIDVGYAPTCTAEGRTSGSHCAVCSVVLEKQDVIPVIGHSYVDGRCACGKAEIEQDPNLLIQ
ncbi:MAG: prepilin peptidase, partial [Oscillospiraceae bacterium]|nr:prepilin peptidase [Oscillospiraceae bacterium]